MSDLENPFDFSSASDDVDISEIFGDAAKDGASDPFAAFQEPDAQPPKATDEPAEQPSAEPEPDLFSALAPKGGQQPEPAKPKQEAPQQTSISLFDKPPVFSYGSVTENIEDTSMTFEELRIAKADDFPELAEGKRVSWTVDYGKVAKSIPDPKGTTIAKIKEEIEKSKQFLDGIKKATKDKEKNPDCLVKPRVTAQSKGIAAYKGVFGTLEAARESDKAICILPANDGKVYELRKTEMGEFIAPKSNITEFSEIRAGFIPALPLIPKELVGQIISFFRCYMNEGEEFEALAHIYWDRETESYTVFIPNQEVTKAHIDADLRGSALPEQRYLHYADIHSHNSMEAKFSWEDDRDERATRLYFVVGRLNRFYPSIRARISCGGVYQPIDPGLVIEGIGEEFPVEWCDNVHRAPRDKRESGAELKGLDALLKTLPAVLV